MKVSVIIPTHNRSDALRLTLAQLSRQQFDGPWEVIVVNNRCTDDTDELVTRMNFPVPLRLEHEEVPGAAAARNAGVAVATGEYLLFMDNDILVEPDFVSRHVKTLREHPGCWVVGQIANLPEHEATPFGRYRKTLSPLLSTKDGVSEARGLTGANFSMPRADMARLGGFDEKFDVASHEDLELAVRAWKAGITILLDPGIIGVHNDWAGTSIADYCLRQRMYCRTEPLFWRKYGSEYVKQDLLVENLPLNWGKDRPKIILRKLTKQLVGNRVGQIALIKICGLLEATWPWPPALWRLYRLAIAGAMNKGFREGLGIYTNGPGKP
jgi:GT2 family glycosyltransferase